MAGNLNSTPVMWNVGDTTGRDITGGTVALPVGPTVVGAGSAVPTAAPAGAPLYVDTDNDDLYVWTGAAWLGPYSKAT